QERQVAPQTVAGREVGAVELPGARGPETLARIVLRPDVEVHDLRAIDRREPHDLSSADPERVTGSDRNHRLADLPAAVELGCKALDQRRIRGQRAVATGDV